MTARRSPCVADSPAVLRSRPDERLAELARDGSEAAFEEIVARHRMALVRLCAHILGDADAEEAVQETLLKAHAAIIRGDQVVRTVEPWLRTIAHNTGLNMLRARGSRPTVPDGDAACPQLTDGSAEHRQKFREVVSAVASLPARQREAMVLREFEGRSYEEIGARLGASDGAVRQLLNRARGALRTRVGAFAGFEPVLRWLIGNGASEGAVRLGALSGGCAITIKICASALPAALMLGSVAPAPKCAGKAQTAQVTSEHPTGSAGPVTAVAQTRGKGLRAVFSSVSVRPTDPRSSASSPGKPGQVFLPPAAAQPQQSAPRPSSGGPLSAAGPPSPAPRPQSAARTSPGSPAAVDHRGPGGSAGPGPAPGTGTGTGTAPPGATRPISLTEARRRPAGQGQQVPGGGSTSSSTSPGPGPSGASVALGPRP
jgi:RNA polymerase sigma factor (sigma-70 family)